jgi:hypothetical protein
MGSTAHYETAEFSDDEVQATLLPSPVTLAAVQDNFLSFLYCIYH